jgi:hypothetical protein
MKHILFLACLTLGMKACETIDGDKVGDIGPSKMNLHFSAQGGVDTITTQETSWWIGRIMLIDGKSHQLHYEQDTTTGQYFLCCFKTEDGEDVRVTKSDPRSGTGIGKIEGPWFIIDKVTKQMLTFAIAPNETGKSRKLVLGLDAGNYGKDITVAQAAE